MCLFWWWCCLFFVSCACFCFVPTVLVLSRMPILFCPVGVFFCFCCVPLTFVCFVPVLFFCPVAFFFVLAPAPGRGRAGKCPCGDRRQYRKLEGGTQGFWDGGKKTEGRSRVVLWSKVWKKDKRITIRKIAVPLTTCTAIAADNVGACVVNGISDLALGNITVKHEPVH